MTPTLPQILARNAREHGPEVALREKELGIWRSITWADYDGRTRLFALGLQALGVEPGERVAVLDKNGPAYLELYFALPRIGAVIAGLRGLWPQELAQATTANALAGLPRLAALWLKKR